MRDVVAYIEAYFQVSGNVQDAAQNVHFIQIENLPNTFFVYIGNDPEKSCLYLVIYTINVVWNFFLRLRHLLIFEQMLQLLK